jgi:hypothetical protein
MSERFEVLAENLLRSATIVWRHPRLIPYGVLLAFAPFIRIAYVLLLLQSLFVPADQGLRFFQISPHEGGLAIVLIHAFVIITFFILPYLAFGNIAMEVNSAQIKRVRSGRGASLLKRPKRFIPLLIGLSLTALFLYFVSLLAVFTPTSFLASNLNRSWTTILLLLAVLFLIPLFATIRFSHRFARLYAVLAPVSFISSVRNGYKLFSKNVIQTLLTSLSLSLINILGLLTATLVAIPIYFFLASIGKIVGFEGFWLSCAATMFAVIVILAESVLSTYNHTVWTIVFRCFAGPKDKAEAHSSKQDRAEVIALPRLLGTGTVMQHGIER